MTEKTEPTKPRFYVDQITVYLVMDIETGCEQDRFDTWQEAKKVADKNNEPGFERFRP